jgi:hypothetical protein
MPISSQTPAGKLAVFNFAALQLSNCAREIDYKLESMPASAKIDFSILFSFSGKATAVSV